MKKLIALVLALAMVATIGLAFASGVDNSNLGSPFDEGNVADTDWSGVNDGSIALGGLNQGDTVKFYKILEYDQDARGTLGTDLNAHSWKVIAPFLEGTGAVTAVDLQAILTTGITADMAGRIAKNAVPKANGDEQYKYTATANASGVASVTPAEAGLYVAIVTPANAGFMYNPVFVASDYYVTSGTSVSNSFTAVESPLSYSNKAMAKKSPITVTKTATEKSGDDPSYEYQGAEAVAKGDTIQYTITTTIPEFADNYLKPLFVVSDTLSAGLDLVHDIAVTGTGITADDYTISYPASGPDFKVTFKPASLLALSAATDITITYSATVTEAAFTNVNEEDNTVTVEYSHNPSVDDEGEGKKVGDKTHHYTFTIDGNIWGTTGSRTSEIVKVGIDKNGNEITQETTIINQNKIGALANAEFKLYTDSACTTEYNKGPYAAAAATTSGNRIVSDEKGNLNINGTSKGIFGLDAGTYYLREEKAPDGYIRQQNAIKITIAPTFYEELTLTEGTGSDAFTYKCTDLLNYWTVTIDTDTTATYTVHYRDVTSGKPTTDVVSDNSSGDKTGYDITIGNTGPITTDPAETGAGDDDGKIKNTQGTELPSTGGIGTTLFYVIGGLLVIGAAVILVARRKAHE